MAITETSNQSITSLKGVHLYHFGMSSCSQRVRFALEEKGVGWERHPAIFLRTPTSLAAHNQSLLLLKVNNKLDYEAELLVVIGKQAKYLTVDNALDAVWGYSLFNDGSVRPYQRWSTQWTMSKYFDQTGGLGPWIVTPDELPLGAKGLNIEMRLNDQVMQQANTDDMVFDVVNTLVQISECMTLQPGDCIAWERLQGWGIQEIPPCFCNPEILLK